LASECDLCLSVRVSWENRKYCEHDHENYEPLIAMLESSHCHVPRQTYVKVPALVFVTTSVVVLVVQLVVA
jgi:hypothetical protein